MQATVAMPDWARWTPFVVHPIIISPTVGAALVTADMVYESDLKRGDRAINITLVADTWADDVGSFGHAVNAELVSGAWPCLRTAASLPCLPPTPHPPASHHLLTPPSSQPRLRKPPSPSHRAGLSSSNVDTYDATGWNRVVRRTLAFLATSVRLVERLSDTVVRVAVPFMSGYDISRTDTITAVVPRAAVRTNMTTQGDSFDIKAVAGSATLRGSLARSPTEETLRSAPTVVSIQLYHDAWRSDLQVATLPSHTLPSHPLPPTPLHPPSSPSPWP